MTEWLSLSTWAWKMSQSLALSILFKAGKVFLFQRGACWVWCYSPNYGVEISNLYDRVSSVESSASRCSMTYNRLEDWEVGRWILDMSVIWKWLSHHTYLGRPLTTCYPDVLGAIELQGETWSRSPSGTISDPFSCEMIKFSAPPNSNQAPVGPLLQYVSTLGYKNYTLG